MIRIITDSAADFEPEDLQQLGITCIPLPVLIGETEYKENETLSKPQFYRLLSQTKEFPKTSQASPQILQALLEEAHRQGDDAIYITLSSALSGTYQTSVMIRDTLGYENCYVVDSLNATGGQRMLVEHAVRLRREGKTAAQIVSSLESLRDRIVLYACMDTMEFLYRGGRISHTVYTLGSLAHIKPIIQVDAEGRVEVPAKAMGMRKGMDFLCKRLAVQPPDPDFPLYVMYTSDRSIAQSLAQRLQELGFQVPPQRIIGVGAAIGSHVGPGACGLVYIEK